MLAYDEREVWLVRQPREAVGEPDLLEIPAGRLDKQGEEPLAGRQARARRGDRPRAPSAGSRSSPTTPAPASPTSACTCSRPPELHEASADSGEQERIEVVPWPLGELDEAIAECRDAKTLIALYWLARRLNA